jgi:hypothetical protein
MSGSSNAHPHIHGFMPTLAFAGMTSAVMRTVKTCNQPREKTRNHFDTKLREGEKEEKFGRKEKLFISLYSSIHIHGFK